MAKTFQQILNEEMIRQGIGSERLAILLREVGATVTGGTIRQWRRGESLPGFGHAMPLCRVLRKTPSKLVEAAYLQARAAA